MKQQIIFIWLNSGNLGYSDKSIVDKFCEENNFIGKWQKTIIKNRELVSSSCWSIGVFEEDYSSEIVDKIYNFFKQYYINSLTKMTKSRNDVQAKFILSKGGITQLMEVMEELKKEDKRENKKNPTFTIEEILNKYNIDEIEKLYRYKFTEEDLTKYKEHMMKYISSYGVLEKYFK